jgi:transposase
MLERHASRETVKAVAIDLSEPLRQAVEMALPDAVVVADKFHVLALAGPAAAGEVHGEKRQRGSAADRSRRNSWLIAFAGGRSSVSTRTSPSWSEIRIVFMRGV